MYKEIENHFNKVIAAPNEHNFKLLLQNICISQSLAEDKPQSILFDLDNGISLKSYIASCMLRIIDSCSEIFWEDQRLRIKLIKLFDNVYSEVIYKILKLEVSQQAHEKFSIFKSIASSVLAEAVSIEKSIVSMETALSARKKYMKYLSKPLTKIFTDNHIYDPSLVSVERLSEFYNIVDQYHSASRLQKLSTYKRLKEIYLSFDDSLNKHQDNEYIRKIVSSIMKKLFLISESDFAKSDLRTSAEIILSNTNRKYPLHSLEQRFPIKFILVNKGPGVAFDLKVNIVDSDSALKLEASELSVGDIDVGNYELTIKAVVVEESINAPMILGEISWEDYKGEKEKLDFDLEVTPQNRDISWEKIKYLQPYSLESVDSEEDLVGRKDLLENISSKLSLKKAESSIIYGQKRVGKTSLARTIQSRFANKKDYISIFVDTGSLDKSSPESFMKSLGEKIVKRILLSLKTNKVKIDAFSSSLYPLVSFTEDIVSLHRNIRIIIVVDEFDEIPSRLYPYTEEGDSFFHSIRSLSGESGEGRVSLILVGSENMNVIMQSTDKLNKFDAYNVGYFDKSESWEDFRELVTAPVRDTIEYSDDSIVTLYEMTEGNPFYTKYIAKILYRRMCEKHFSYISSDEMNDAIRETILNMEAINVNHFWSDGIRVEDSEKRDLIETHRRRFLIAFAEQLRTKKVVSKSDIINDQSVSSIPAKEILDSFISRKIIVGEKDNLKIKPVLFQKWLVEKGIHTLRASFSDKDALEAYMTIEEKSYVTDIELVELTDKWDLYRGMEISPTKVKSWLSQFDNNKERRLMFKLLENVNFYGEAKIREKLKIIHKIIQKEIIYSFKSRERVRKDLIVSSFGTISKSGASYVRMYASENNITSHNIKNNSDIKKTILADENIQALIFIDDIIATGGTIVEELKILKETCGEIIRERGIVIVIGVITGFSDGVDHIQFQIEQMEMNVKLQVCDILLNRDKAFSEDSVIFDNIEQFTTAQSVARLYGSKLQKMHPLGFNNSQLLVVFKDNCPNNTLPIFWETSSNPKWIPLFKRS